MDIAIKEVKQAGDCFCLTFICPFCNEECFQVWPLKYCDHCKKDFSSFPIELPKGRSHYILLAGSYRKPKGGLSKKKIRNLHEEQEGLCAYCSQQLEDYHVEHIQPLSMGGTNAYYNLCLACPRCNSLAGSKTFSDFSAKRLYILQKRKNS